MFSVKVLREKTLFGRKMDQSPTAGTTKGDRSMFSVKVLREKALFGRKMDQSPTAARMLSPTAVLPNAAHTAYPSPGHRPRGWPQR